MRRSIEAKAGPVKAPKVPAWLAHLVSAIGGAGIFVVAFLDSSVLSFPFITDLLFIELVIQHPDRTLYYIAMAAGGSLAGCIWLFLLAKKGGDAYRRRHPKQTPGKVQALVNKYAFLSVLVPSILPPPFPFKAFVIAEGITQVPLQKFLFGVLLGRGLRYGVEGLFAIKYGSAVVAFMIRNRTIRILSPLLLFAAIYMLTAWLLKPPPSSHKS